jgi:hypothetical protein
MKLHYIKNLSEQTTKFLGALTEFFSVWNTITQIKSELSPLCRVQMFSRLNLRLFIRRGFKLENRIKLQLSLNLGTFEDQILIEFEIRKKLFFFLALSIKK